MSTTTKVVCADTSCESLCQDFKHYCNEHRCEFDTCYRPRVGGTRISAKYCLQGHCAVDGCKEEVISQGGPSGALCKAHCCYRWIWVEKIDGEVNVSQHCTKHTCQTGGCFKEKFELGDGDHCRDHCGIPQ